MTNIFMGAIVKFPIFVNEPLNNLYFCENNCLFYGLCWRLRGGGPGIKCNGGRGVGVDYLSWTRRSYSFLWLRLNISESRERKGHDTHTTHKTVIRTDPYFISFADLLLLITQISLAAFKVTFHIFNTYLLRAAGVFAVIHGLGRALSSSDVAQLFVNVVS